MVEKKLIMRKRRLLLLNLKNHLDAYYLMTKLDGTQNLKHLDKNVKIDENERKISRTPSTVPMRTTQLCDGVKDTINGILNQYDAKGKRIMYSTQITHGKCKSDTLKEYISD